MESLNESIREYASKYIKTIAMDLVVVIVALAYVFYQMISFETTSLNPLVLLAQAFMGIVCGIIIKVSLGENGFSKGYNSDIWREEEDKYNETCSNYTDYVDDRLDNYYLYKEIEEKEIYRRKNLQAVRLKYSNWFDDDGNFIGTKEKEKKLKMYQKIVLHKCIRVRVYPLNLFSEYANTSEQYTKKEITDKSQRAKNVAKNSVSAVLIAIIGVYFIPVINSWNWASFISSTMQVALWVLFGILQLYTNYNFVVKEKVSVLRKKKEELVIYGKNCEKGMYKENPYLKNKVVEQNKLECDNNTTTQDFVSGGK